MKITCPKCQFAYQIIPNERVQRSKQQNSYYWGVVIPIAGDEFGYDSEEMHEAFKILFLSRNEDGKPATVRSTVKLSTIEFNDYIEKCQRWCAEQGIIIPDPGELIEKAN